MLDIDQLTQTVQQNCHISDAYHAGNYSMCTFLMKMREYYRWEQNIPLSEPLSREQMGKWLIDREATWDAITDTNSTDHYSLLKIRGIDTDPFDASMINNSILEQGYIYSSGYGIFNKPHFFIGQLERKQSYNNYTLYVSSREYARDLTAPPAMLQGSNIFIRQESIRRFVWEKIEEWQWKNNPDAAIAHMIRLLGKDNNIENILDQAVENETETMILHEIGEIEAGKLLGPRWEEMLASLARSKSELLLRAARDILADCLYTVPKLIEKEQWPSLHFYFANFSGMRKSLFPDLYDAYSGWIDTGNTRPLLALCSQGAESWQNRTQQILLSYKEERKRLENIIESSFVIR